MRLLVLEHEGEAPAGLLAGWAAARGHELVTARPQSLERWPSPESYDALVSLGSEDSMAGAVPSWMERELELLRAAKAADVATLGICFGGQALARALGGEVRADGALHVMWEACETLAPELVPAGPWLRWHEDVFTIPAGARELARAGQVPMAFADGRSVGLQFHPEADGEIVELWIAGSLRGAAGHRLDADGLRAEVAAAMPRARERAEDLFDRIAGHWGWS